MTEQSEEEYSLEVLLSAIYHSLTTGANMNGGNYAFALLCDKLGVDEDDLIFLYNTKWVNRYREATGSNVQEP